MKFEVFTEEMCKSWLKLGKKTLELLLEDVAQKNLTSQQCFENEHQDFNLSLYEVTYQVLYGNCKVDDFVSVIKDYKDKCTSLCSDLIDIWSLVDCETNSLNGIDDRKSLRDIFLKLVSASMEHLDPVMFKARFDLETLAQLKVIADAKAFQQRYIKTKTRLFYKQLKFNLLREEMEGYSKLLVELGDVNNKYKLDSENTLEIVKSLIGCFNIDPNRALDILLEAMECHPSKSEQIFVPVIQQYLKLAEKTTLCNLLGFKFTHYQQKEHSTPSSLYTLAALLVHHKLVCINDLFVHLTPEDKQLKDNWQNFVKQVDQEAVRTTVMVLNKDERKDDKPAKLDVMDGVNQKFMLCEASLKIGDWKTACDVIEMYELNHVMSYRPITTAACNLVDYFIDKLYKRKVNNKHLKSSSASYDCSMFATLQQPANFPGLVLDTPVFQILSLIGPKLSCQPALLVKIIRLARVFVSQYYSSTKDRQQEKKVVMGKWIQCIIEAILPSMSLLTCNANISFELWGLLKHMPYQIRYRLYGEWKNESYERHPEMQVARAKIIDKTKYIMRRLTKENVKQTGRQMGKLSHSSPCVLFDSILSQIQRYDNLIGPVVDSLRYVTDLSYDCLAYCIIEALANPDKERMKCDDTNISNWLQSLASFCGNILKKYSIELSGLLQYVANQLKAGKSLDLLILKEVIQKMSGIEISDEVTNDQLEALQGGELLKAEAAYFGQIRNTKKSSTRLKESLINEGLAVPLCVLMAQQRSGVVFMKSSENMHLKLVGKLADQCHDTMMQFGNFLSNQLPGEEYVKRFPPINSLYEEYHTPPDAAFFLSRTMFQHLITQKYDELRKQDKKKSDKTSRYIRACEVVMKPVNEAVVSMHDATVWKDLSPSFYTTFWTLSLYDLQVPKQAYQRQVKKLEENIKNLDGEGHSESRKRREREKIEVLISKLKEEQKKQEEHCSKVKSRMKNGKDNWFLAKTTKNDTITKFLQLCVFPRCVFSAQDAIYCANIIQQLHLMKTNNFSTLLCFDRLFTDISTTVTSLTENEASRYGRFLNQMLTMVKNWHASKSTYEKNCGDSPGFVTLLRANSNENKLATNLDFENFRHVCHKWQYKLTKAVVVLLESGEFCQIRNALVVLTKILPCFPAVTGLGQALEKRVEKIGQEEKDKRPDIFALAMGYLGQLRSKKSSMIPESVYHKKKSPPKTQDVKKEATKSATSTKSENKRSYSKTKDVKTSTKRKSEPDSNSKPDKKKDRSESKDRNSSKSKETNSKDRSSNGGDSKKNKMPPPTNGSGEPTDSKRRKVDTSTNGARESSKSKVSNGKTVTS